MAKLSIGGAERRGNPRRRARDRIASGPPARALQGGTETADLRVLFEDDLREAALALASVEGWIARVGALVDHDRVARAALAQVAGEPEVVARLDALSDHVAQLRRRLARLALTVE